MPIPSVFMQFPLIWIALLLASDTPESGDRELRQKVVCGYQGWFGASGDGTGVGFDNYQFNHEFKPGRCVIDYWPDLSEFAKDEKFATSFKFADGSTASVFSSAHPKTVDRHFRWMKQYRIDGIFLQRFGHALKPSVKTSEAYDTLNHRNRVLQNVRESARRHGRIWALMYDLTSLSKGDIEKYVIPDFKTLVDEKGLLTDTRMTLHNGKPLIAIWGIGLSDGRSYSLQECQRLIDFLKHDRKYGGNAVMVGVPFYWRQLKQDAINDKQLHNLIKSADVVCPWSVGRLRSMKDVQGKLDHYRADLRWTSRNQLGYLPVIYPGFSWENLAAQRSDLKQSWVPRLAGRFLWQQAAVLKQSGAESIYVAMFDEMNEGTCIFKCSDRTPVGESKFRTYGSEGVPNDHYLWLTGQIGRLVRGQIASEFPVRNQPK